jgi:hypothetical protein
MKYYIQQHGYFGVKYREAHLMNDAVSMVAEEKVSYIKPLSGNRFLYRDSKGVEYIAGCVEDLK